MIYHKKSWSVTMVTIIFFCCPSKEMGVWRWKMGQRAIYPRAGYAKGRKFIVTIVTSAPTCVGQRRVEPALPRPTILCSRLRDGRAMTTHKASGGGGVAMRFSKAHCVEFMTPHLYQTILADPPCSPWRRTHSSEAEVSIVFHNSDLRRFRYERLWD